MTVKQERSLKTYNALIDAAVSIIARDGVARLTHRQLAAEAGTSLAATTYYFSSKGEILRQASRKSLEVFSALVQRAAEAEHPAVSGAFSGFDASLVDIVLQRHRVDAAAWLELFLDAAKHTPSQEQTRIWQAEMHTTLKRLLPTHDDVEVWAAMDRALGVLFVALALGLSREQVFDVIAGDSPPPSAWNIERSQSLPLPDAVRKSPKAQKTRSLLIETATELMLEQGVGEIGFRQVARRADLAPTAPSYHFASVEHLINEARQRLLLKIQNRNIDALREASENCQNLGELSDFISVVFQREIQTTGAQNRAMLEVCLDAHRQPDLAPVIWAGVADQCLAWDAALTAISPEHHGNAAFAEYAGFLGRMARILALGVRDSDLSGGRKIFVSTLSRALRVTNPT